MNFQHTIPDNSCPMYQSSSGGLSLRDWFAGMAMQVVVANTRFTSDQKEIAIWAYMMADAMLAERESKGGA